MMNKIAVIVAVESESPELVKQSGVYLSGLGKINAARTTTEIILQHRPDLIINFGSAGGITVNSGLHRVSKLIQRDMNCSGLGYSPGVTPFELNHDVIELDCQGVICGTGDNFVAGQPPEINCDIVDMEAYSIASVCRHHQVSFASWKWISDTADHNASTEWVNNNHLGQNYFVEIYHEILKTRRLP
jgi:adenosylhomocysteine nucleosidase